MNENSPKGDGAELGETAEQLMANPTTIERYRFIVAVLEKPLSIQLKPTSTWAEAALAITRRRT